MIETPRWLVILFYGVGGLLVIIGLVIAFIYFL
jgi:hypothetical protein